MALFLTGCRKDNFQLSNHLVRRTSGSYRHVLRTCSNLGSPYAPWATCTVRVITYPRHASTCHLHGMVATPFSFSEAMGPTCGAQTTGVTGSCKIVSCSVPVSCRGRKLSECKTMSGFLFFYALSVGPCACRGPLRPCACSACAPAQTLRRVSAGQVQQRKMLQSLPPTPRASSCMHSREGCCAKCEKLLGHYAGSAGVLHTLLGSKCCRPLCACACLLSLCTTPCPLTCHCMPSLSDASALEALAPEGDPPAACVGAYAHAAARCMGSACASQNQGGQPHNHSLGSTAA